MSWIQSWAEIRERMMLTEDGVKTNYLAHWNWDFDEDYHLYPSLEFDENAQEFEPPRKRFQF